MSPSELAVLQSIATSLRERNWKLAVAESLTGGNVQALITSISGASGYFVGGVVAYTVAGKIELLGIDRETAHVHNGVSADIAQQMAEGVARLFRADCAIATTGYAEPSEGSNVSVPFAYCCVAVRDGGTMSYRTERFDASGCRIDVQRAIAWHAVELLRDTIMMH